MALNGQPVPDLTSFIQQIKQAGKGAVFQLGIWRRGGRSAISAGLGGAKEAYAYANSEQRIAAYGAIVAEFPATAFPVLWTQSQNNLGAEYLSRVQGSRADNLESAIAAYRAALSVPSREASP